MPLMQCVSGQFFDEVRYQCISCIEICPPNRARDKLCESRCPQMPGTAEVIGPNDVPTSFSFNILFATVVPIIALVVIICFGIWMKRRRDQGAVSNVDHVSIEMQPIGLLLPNGEPESNTDEKIRIGGDPEENADHTATQLLPNGSH